MTDPTQPGVAVRAPAKINLHLGVGPVRADGYHPLATAYQAISLYSSVTAWPAEDWSVTCTAIPTGLTAARPSRRWWRQRWRWGTTISR